MTTVSSRAAGDRSPSRRWSVAAGGFIFLCSAILLLILSPFTDTLGRLLWLPTGVSAFLFAGPVAFLGAGVWWTVVERRRRYTYLLGGVAGVLAAIVAVLFWALVFAVVWGPSSLRVGGILVVFVLAVSVPVAFVSGLPLMYARRRLAPGLD